jgi:uncharacterized protein
VFATRHISASVTIDISPVLLMPNHESEGTTLAHYTYTWPAKEDIVTAEPQFTVLLSTSGTVSSSTSGDVAAPKSPRQALALGLGSMFNHKRIPNVAWERSILTQSIRYFTLRDIEEGEELCISYGPKLWFIDVDGSEEDPDGDDGFLSKVDVFE